MFLKSCSGPGLEDELKGTEMVEVRRAAGKPLPMCPEGD